MFKFESEALETRKYTPYARIIKLETLLRSGWTRSLKITHPGSENKALERHLLSVPAWSLEHMTDAVCTRI